VEPGASVTLDGSGSRDSDGSITSWRWEQTDGPAVDLAGSTEPRAAFVAPSPSVPAELLFRLTVTDDDGASGFDTVRVTVTPTDSGVRVELAGAIESPRGQELDGDTNNPDNPLLSNDDPLQPQRIGNPTTLGGYVNEAGSGAPGRSFVAGDPEDYFAVELLAGQRVNLLVADFQEADADLYLYSADGELLDFSLETGFLEELVVAESGQYLVNVSIFSGASNYTLAIGAPLGSRARPGGYDDVIPWQSVITFDPQDRDLLLTLEDLARRWDTRELGGWERRARLLAMSERVQAPQVLEARLGRQRFRREQFADDSQLERW